MKKLLVALGVVSVLMSSIEARVWTRKDGQKVEAEFVRLEGGSIIVLSRGGREFKVNKFTLSEADQNWAKAQDVPKPIVNDKPAPEVEDEREDVQEGEKKVEAVEGIQLLGVAVQSGKNVIPMDMASHLDSLSDKNREHSKKAEIQLFLPDGFDPSKQYNVMITTATSSGKASQKGSIGPFGKRGIAEGWIVMTADSVLGRPPNFSVNYRVQMIDAALDKMHEEWPNSVNWKYAAAGFSGGAKCAQAMMEHLGSRTFGSHKMIGGFIGGCNECWLGKGESKSKHVLSSSKRRKLAIFFSQGKSDTIANLKHADKVIAEMREESVRNVKLVTFDGGHRIHGEHVTEAYKWLAEQAKEME